LLFFIKIIYPSVVPIAINSDKFPTSNQLGKLFKSITLIILCLNTSLIYNSFN